MNLPQHNQTLEYYRDYIRGTDKDVDLHEKKTGYLHWLRGHAINMFMASKQIKHGQYGKFLEHIKMTPQTAFLCREIARLIPQAKAQIIRYTDMLYIVDQLKKGNYDDPDEVPLKIKQKTKRTKRFVPSDKQVTVDSKPITRVNTVNLADKVQDALTILENAVKVPIDNRPAAQALEVYEDALQTLKEIETVGKSLRAKLSNLVVKARKHVA